VTDTEAEDLLRDTMRARAEQIEVDDLSGLLSQPRGRARMRAATVVGLATLATAAVAVGIVALGPNGGGPTPTASGAGPASTAPTPAPGPHRVRVTGTVIDSPEHGPQVCWAVLTSWVPQCGKGIDLLGWDWAQVEGEESRQGTTFGDFEITGTWDGVRVTVTQPVGPPPASSRHNPSGFETPCPAPPGGWAVVDPTKTSQRAFDAALSAARGRPDFGQASYDMQPATTVLIVWVTGDTAAAEHDLRAIWGGAVCVATAKRTYAELETILSEVNDDLHSQQRILSIPDPVAGTVYVTVLFDDGTLQKWLDDRYGRGLVTVKPWLQPIA
jgi:hypothetical protein